MTDFTHTIEATAASVEDLQEDLEAHLEDMIETDVNVYTAGVDVDTDDTYDETLPPEATFKIDLEGEFADELEDRLGGTVSTAYLKIGVELESDGDPE
ncbi:hypothetical protein [Natronobacterium gregoryi]|uniref:Uncharacterized protein n=2 Tax=Natronobacterium gregoryi TaxID=44930 RepID=L0AKY7_NATGS|nr:hypothetical protein [Natronobacterium gregoryi]AFZ74563.1 hypothetical protein Natgr_3444 [Natronobacterium gregoryi SP2]ELY72367.1 hypothetical protein C490_03448 [Natronobacterium gregoryi SP2]PLK21695.1 hypothetical protein CYV19_02340 [Natronobacterium gregoryi SP2]SFI96164.1 hypothetical protein SAMN05443661_110142 [Natronobacterium gregoryi]